MIKNWKKYASIILLGIIVGLFIFYIIKNIDDFKRLELVNPFSILFLVLLTLLSSFFIGLQTKYLLKAFKINLTPTEWFGLSVTTTFYNLITPFRGGAISRAQYLKKKHHFTYTQFLATMSGSYVIGFLAQSIVGLLSLLILYITKGIVSIPALIIYLIFLLPLLTLTLFSPKLPHVKYKLVNKVIDIVNGWHSIRKNKQVIATTIISSISLLIIISTSAIIVYNSLGIHLSIPAALLMSTMGALSIIISITPAGLGIAESVAILTGFIVGITPAQALAASLIGRAVWMAVIFILGPIFSYLLFKKIKN